MGMESTRVEDKEVFHSHCPGGPSNAWPDASFIFGGLRPSRAVHTSRVGVKSTSYSENHLKNVLVNGAVFPHQLSKVEIASPRGN